MLYEVNLNTHEIVRLTKEQIRDWSYMFFWVSEADAMSVRELSRILSDKIEREGYCYTNTIREAREIIANIKTNR